jgi:hypothetical protein
MKLSMAAMPSTQLVEPRLCRNTSMSASWTVNVWNAAEENGCVTVEEPQECFPVQTAGSNHRHDAHSGAVQQHTERWTSLRTQAQGSLAMDSKKGHIRVVMSSSGNSGARTMHCRTMMAQCRQLSWFCGVSRVAADALTKLIEEYKEKKRKKITIII